MANKTVRGPHYDSVLARNLRLLVELEAGNSVNTWSKKTEINQSTVNRICNGTMDTKLSTLLDIAYKSGYAPWQLIMDGFDPRIHPPMLNARAMRVAAIYAQIESAVDQDRAASIMEQFAPAGDEDEPAAQPRLLPAPQP